MKQIEDSHMQQESASESHTHHRRRKYNLVNFTKMHGLGNDFMVIESMTQKVNLTPELIRSWSDRHTGIGFDQLLLLSAPETQGADFQYSIFNSDGSEAGQCGNGARAIARFIVDQKLSLSAENVIATKTNRMQVRILESGQAQVDMDTPEFRPAGIPFDPTAIGKPTTSDNVLKPWMFNFKGQEITFYPISVGNPHAVIFVDNINDVDGEIATTLQQHPCFPEGVNVGFAQPETDSSIRLRVFERGAGETQACGSGATAAAIAAVEAGKVSSTQVDVHLKGGSLSIIWDKKQLQMTGPAVRVFTGRLLVRHDQIDKSHSF